MLGRLEFFLYKPTHCSRRLSWCFSSQVRKSAAVAKKTGSSNADFTFDLFNHDAFPKGDAVFDVESRFFRIWIIPGGIFVHIAVDDNVMITCFAFPRTSCVRRVFAEMRAVNRICREVVIAFDNQRLVALSKCRALP